jgi:hypothetical protein
MRQENLGVDFEKIVTSIQQRFDLNSTVLHNQILTDRLGHKRQFDVVIRGVYAGQELLGVIECKDLKRKVGTPELDAFITKSSDVNASFKIFVSRKGFSKTAIEKARHYGIQTLSLLPKDQSATGFIVGTWWFADVYFWERFSVTLLQDGISNEPFSFSIEELKINNQLLLDWFKNYLLDNHNNEIGEGWHGVEIEFENKQFISISDTVNVECSGVKFEALRTCQRKEKLVGLSGDAFFDWQNNQVKFPAGTELVTHAVDMYAISMWADRQLDRDVAGEFFQIKLVMSMKQFVKLDDVISLDTL